MNGFKRFCLVIFALAGGASLAGLALTWFGPWTEIASNLLLNEVYLIALQVCMIISVAGFTVCLLMGLFSRNIHSLTVATLDGGVISVTRDAIVSQAKSAVAAEGDCLCERVRVDITRGNRVRVSVRVIPQEALDVTEVGPRLYRHLETYLAAVCGDTVASINIAFVDGANFSPREDLSEENSPEETADSSDKKRNAEVSDQPMVSADSSSEIRVSMTAEHGGSETSISEEA